MITKLRIDQIIVDHDIQIREATNTDAIKEYAEKFDDLPPVIVFQDGNRNYLADGFHRLAAANSLKKLRIDCDVRQGTKRDAILFACGANRAHGLRRTNEDKRRAVWHLLTDDEWAKWSDRKIAELAGVSNNFVSVVRGQVSSDDTSILETPGKTEEKRVGSDGKTYPATKPKKFNIPAFDDSQYEDVSDDEPLRFSSDEEYEPPKPTTKEQVSKLRSVALQHYKAAMRAVDDMQAIKKDKASHAIVERENVVIQDAVTEGWK